MKHKSDLLPAVFLLSFLVIVGRLAMYLPQPPEPLPATAAPSEFSAERAFRYVEVLGREVHPIGCLAQARVREYIVRQLEELGLVPEIQESTVVDPQAILDARSAVAYFGILNLGLFYYPETWATPLGVLAALLAATALPALLFCAPMIYSFHVTLGTDLILVPVLVQLLQGLLIPHLALIAHPLRRALPTIAGFVLVGALIGGSLTAAPDAANPQSDSLSYALNADTHQALWISEDAEPDAWTAQFLGTDFKRMPLPEVKPDLSKVYLTATAPVLSK